jgi:LuxR family maltose regulon positive regulatory protein
VEALIGGQDALRRGAWEEARDRFRDALADAESPAALEGLGWAAWWLDDAATVFDARERALRLYHEAGDPRGAARVAMWLARDYIDFRGEQAVADGLLLRARRLLDASTKRRRPR